MAVSVVNIGHVGMLVRHWIVTMRMCMPHGKSVFMGVSIVKIIVSVPVVVFD